MVEGLFLEARRIGVGIDCETFRALVIDGLWRLARDNTR